MSKIKQFQKGDLVYIPSEVTLYQFDENAGIEDRTVIRYKKTKTPTPALMTGINKSGYCQVLYDGEQWSAMERDLFELIEANHGG